MNHGYTNQTDLVGGVVRKHFRGAEAEQRAKREAAALRWAIGRLPVPEVVMERPGELDLQLVQGHHAQDALDWSPRSVLRRCGELARRLASLRPPSFLRDGGSGTVVVHGDFGPQNILLDDDLREVVALLDWERVHLGRPGEDLAWAEWIVRRHHPEAVTDLDALFTGYGRQPSWPDRKQAMLSICREHFAESSRLDDRHVKDKWRDRVRWTEQLHG